MKTALILLIGLCFSLSVWAEEIGPLEALQKPIDNILTILKDPSYKENSQIDAQYHKIREIIDDIFNFKVIAGRAVGKYWRQFTPEEKQIFTEVFADLLSNSYIHKVQGEYHNERVVYLGEQKLSTDKYLVQTKIIRESVDIPVDYSMHLLNDNTWKIYDVNVEGVSLVKNYRTQFNKILLKESPAQLIERVKDKVEQQS